MPVSQPHPFVLERDLAYRLPDRDLQATTPPARSRPRPCSPWNPAARRAAGPGPATRTSGPTAEAGPTDGITYSAPEFIRAGQSIQSFVDVRALWPMSSQKPQSFPIQQEMSKILAHCCRPSRLTFGPKIRGFLDERPEFSSVARAETDNFC